MKLHEIYREYRSDGRSCLEAGALTYVVMPTLSAIMLGSLAVSISALWVVSKLAGVMPPSRNTYPPITRPYRSGR